MMQLSNRQQAAISSQSLPRFTRVLTRYENRCIQSLPQKPDPDVMGICKVFGLPYCYARIMKAFSFGLPIDAPLIKWASDNTTIRHVTYDLDVIRMRVPGFEVHMICRKRGLYILNDPVMLRRIRHAMNGTS
jgi:hypothetical protein